MFRKFLIVIVLLVALMPLAPIVRAQAADGNNAFKAIVKIYTYYENREYYLNPAQTGSGVIISDNGMILTNNHVITVKDGFDNEMPVAFKICLTTDTTIEPDCSYSADLIAKDENKDIALLKIRNIGLSAQTSFDYLDRAMSNTITNNEDVLALGYPAIGGNTISGSMGTIIGTTDKYSLSWIKSSAITSFGSSGGALIDADGKLIGITSAAYADLLGSMGYAINIVSLNGWIADNINKTPQISTLLTRLQNLMIKETSLKTTNLFSNALPHIEITKNNDWEFDYSGEDSLFIGNVKNSTGGFLAVSWEKTDTNQDIMLDDIVNNFVLTRNYFSQGDITLAGKQGKKLIQPISGEENNVILLTSKNYLIRIDYWYGKDSVDKATVDQMKSSLKISDDNNNFIEQRIYQNNDPFFKITLPDTWSLMPLNMVDEPVYGETRNIPEVGFTVYVMDMTENMKSLSNQDYFNFIKDSDYIQTHIEQSFTSLKGERYDESMDYKINNELPHEIFYKYRFKDENDGNKVKMLVAVYRIRDNDKTIVIDYHELGNDEAEFNQRLDSFKNSVLSNFTLGLAVADTTPTADTTNTSTPSVSAPASSGALLIRNLTTAFAKSMIGRILLRVESNGEAWYLSPKTKKAYYLGRQGDAFTIMRQEGYGITNADLNKIPIGITELSGTDSDKDGLSDIFEDAIKTDKNKADTDGDGMTDIAEIKLGRNPNGPGYIKVNTYFAGLNRGKIFLQVESHGEAWYVNPKDGKRYFLGRAADAYTIMRKLSLGITNANFAKIY